MGKTLLERAEAQSALALMEEALELLDRTDYTLEIGPHLDLAICRLRQSLDEHAVAASRSPPDGSAVQSRTDA
jgi:hypothetical protein